MRNSTSLNLCILLMLCRLPVSTSSAQPLLYNTDAAIEALSSLKNLKSLELSETNLSPEGIKELRKALPRSKVTR